MKELNDAEFGNTEKGLNANPRKVIELLRQATEWNDLNDLQLVCVHLGAESDDRIDTVTGCKAIINEDLVYWKKQVGMAGGN